MSNVVEADLQIGAVFGVDKHALDVGDGTVLRVEVPTGLDTTGPAGVRPDENGVVEYLAAGEERIPVTAAGRDWVAENSGRFPDVSDAYREAARRFPPGSAAAVRSVPSAASPVRMREAAEVEVRIAGDFGEIAISCGGLAREGDLVSLWHPTNRSSFRPADGARLLLQEQGGRLLAVRYLLQTPVAGGGRVTVFAVDAEAQSRLDEAYPTGALP